MFYKYIFSVLHSIDIETQTLFNLYFIKNIVMFCLIPTYVYYNVFFKLNKYYICIESITNNIFCH